MTAIGGAWRLAVISCSLGVFCAPAVAGTRINEYDRIAQELGEVIETHEALDAQMIGYDVTFHRDPMRALIDREGQIISVAGLQGGLSVQGVIWSPSLPFVLVDDELRRVGDAIGPYTILEIHPDGVVVQRDGKTLIIPLDRGLDTGTIP